MKLNSAALWQDSSLLIPNMVAAVPIMFAYGG